MAAVETHFAENTGTVQFQFGTQDRITISQSALTPGDRFLLLWKGVIGPNTGTQKYELEIDGVVVQPADGVLSVAAASGRMKEMSGFHVFTAAASGDIILRAVAVSGTSGTRWGSEQILAINIDQTMVEGTDWFLDENDTNDTPSGIYGGESEKPSITFTPDGASDYLILGQLQFNLSTDDDGAWRIRDQTNAADLALCSQGGGNFTTEQQTNLRMHALSAPPATPVTIDIEYKAAGGAPSKDSSRIMAIRLDAFFRHAMTQADLNATPTASRETLTPAISIQPVSGDVILLGSFMAEILPVFGGGYGVWAEIEYDSSVVVESQADSLGTYVNVSSNGGYTKTEAWGGENFFKILTGQAATPTAVQGFGEAESSNPSEHTWRNQTLVAMSVESAPVGQDPAPDPAEAPASGEPLAVNQRIKQQGIARLAAQFRSGSGEPE